MYEYKYTATIKRSIMLSTERIYKRTSFLPNIFITHANVRSVCEQRRERAHNHEHLCELTVEK